MFLPTAASQYASGGTRHHCTKPQIYSWGFKDLNTHVLNIHSLASRYFSIMRIKTPLDITQNNEVWRLKKSHSQIKGYFYTS